METKMITIPFDVELAKKIQNGEYPGKIVTNDNEDVRIVCWDKKDNNKCSILGLIDCEGHEKTMSYDDSGNANNYMLAKMQLFLEVPEWAQFKDGDILACETHYGLNDYRKWLAVLTDKVVFLQDDSIYFFSYVAYDHESTSREQLTYDEYDSHIDSIRLATEEEKQMFIKRLKEENTDKSKEVLKQFFGIEEKPKFEFEPFQKVLVRDSDDEIWMANFFSHYDNDHAYKYVICGNYSFRVCIPYNEQTKHLLGTTDNWEEE